MNNLPREKLIQIIKEQGSNLCDNPLRCKAFLLDYCGEYRGEIKILIDALNEGIVKDLLTISQGTPKQSMLARSKKKLMDLSFQEEAAQWAVESWALALGVITEGELKQYQKHSPLNQNQVFSSQQQSQPESVVEKSPSSQNANQPITNTNPIEDQSPIKDNSPPPVQPQYRTDVIYTPSIQPNTQPTSLVNLNQPLKKEKLESEKAGLVAESKLREKEQQLERERIEKQKRQSTMILILPFMIFTGFIITTTLLMTSEQQAPPQQAQEEVIGNDSNLSVTSENLDFLIHNRTRVPIVHLYVSDSRVDDWEEDVLGNSILNPGQSIKINFSGYSNWCLFDIQIIFADGDKAEEYNVNLCEITDFYVNP